MPSLTEDAEAKLLKLVEALIRQTSTGKLSWDLASPPRLETFGASTRNFSLVISSRDNDGLYPLTLEVLDGNGSRVELHSTETFDNEALIDKMKDLFDEARKTINFPPTEIDQLIAELEEE